MRAERSIVRNGGLSVGAKIFESYAFVEKVRLELKNLGLLFPCLETCSEAIERRKNRLYWAAPMGDKQLQQLENQRIKGTRLLLNITS